MVDGSQRDRQIDTVVCVRVCLGREEEVEERAEQRC